MFTINNFKYRKANITDLEEIANLVTDLLGTCSIDKTDNKIKSENEIITDNKKEQIIYEAWVDKEYVNSKFLLQKLGFKLLKDSGDTYYKDDNYCPYCINRNNNCNSCKAQIWIKNKIN